jgi:hypothetical protein
MAQNLRNDPNKLANRLKKIEYQVLRGIPEGLLTDEIRLRVARAIVDSVIDDDTAIVDSEMPEDILGVDLNWGAGSAVNDAVVGFSIGSLSETADLETGEDFTGGGGEGEEGGGEEVYDWTTASESKLLATDSGKSDFFGSSVSISGDYIVIGASGDNEGGNNTGAAYVFYFDGTNWDAGTKLLAPDAEDSDFFGYSVSIDGDYVIVGTYLEDEGGNDAGAAYVFHRTGTNTWDAGTKLLAPDAEELDDFALSISISGDYVIVGARREDEAGNGAGAAYVFHRTGTNTWDAGTKLLAPDAESGDFFGYSVSIDGDYAIVGAYFEDEGGANAGAAYVFHRTGTNTWDAGTKLLAPDASGNDKFGYSVSIDGDYAIVGAWGESEGGSNAGAAYVFHRTGTNTWDAGTKLLAPDAEANDYFGWSVSIFGDYATIGSVYEGDNDAGAAYVFHRTETNTWDAGTKLLASDAADNDWFGDRTAIDGNRVIIGAPRKDGSASDTGAAYIFKAN